MNEEEPESVKQELRARLLGGEAAGEAPSRAAGATVGQEFPLSFEQRRLWFTERFHEGESSAYNVSNTVRLRGDLDVAALREALSDVVERHAILRTTYDRGDDGEPVQRINDAPAPDEVLTVIDDLENADAHADRLERARQRLQADNDRPFDLHEDLPFRFRLARVDEEDHVLLLTFHHIAFDRLSIGVLHREIEELYQAAAEGGQAEVPRLEMQYVDYAFWQRNELGTDAIEDELSYWEETLEDLPKLDLPLDHPRPPVKSSRGDTLRFRLPDGLEDRVHALAREEEASPFIVGLAAFKLLLSRYTRQHDVAVGTPIAGRWRDGIEDLIGFFVNMLVLRTDLEGEPTFRELVQRVRQTCLEAYDHSRVPFEKLVADLEPERDLSRDPFFQVVFRYQARDERSDGLDLPGVEVGGFRLENRTSKYDLNVALAERDDGLHGTITYDADLFDPETVERLAANLQRVLGASVEAPDTPISQLPVVAEQRRRTILEEWGAAETRFRHDRTVSRRFEEKASQVPDRVAVVDGDRTVTYGELNRRSDAIAAALRERAVEEETLVGLFVDRSVEAIVAQLGVWKAGGAHLPINPEDPPARIRHVLEEADPRLLVVSEELAPETPDVAADVCRLEELERQAPRDLDDDRGLDGARPESCAYVIFTSGSTGNPKGVVVEHRNVTRLFRAAEERFDLREDDVWTWFHNHAFDFSVWEIWGALLTGARVVVVPPDTARDPDRFRELVQREEVTILSQTPSAFRGFDRADARAGGRDFDLRYVVFGGEALDVSSLEDWFDRRGDQTPQLVNMYGITETTVHVTYHEVDRGDLEHPHRSPIGKPLPDLEAYVLDDAGNPAPVGAPGELYVGGAGPARGYLGRPETTREAFVPHPFREDGGRVYRSGDLAAWRPDGTLAFVGRRDRQVQVRGHRVEPGEIETAIGTSDDVDRVVVVPEGDGADAERLVAYAARSGDADVSEADLDEHASQRLPRYMMPARFVVLDEFPLTPNGKVDRDALPEPTERPELDEELTRPRNTTERVLAETWGDVLGLDEVGVRDGFFELGGDSILVLQVVHRLKERDVYVRPRDVFEHPTIAKLAAMADEGGQVIATQSPVTGEAPLGPIQRWFFDRDWRDMHHYNQAVLRRAPDPVDADALERALQAIVRHHDALRASFGRNEEGEWSQTFLPPDEVPSVDLRREDLSDAEDPKETEALLEQRATKLQGGFDLDTPPHLRAGLFDLGPSRGKRLLLAAHHLAIDAVSWRILLEDLQTAYRQLVEGEAMALPDKTTSFKTWTERLESHAREADLDELTEFWRRELARPGEESPFENLLAPGENRIESLETVSVSLAEERTRELLEEVPEAYNTRIEDVLLTALVLAVEDWSGASSAFVEFEGHGREDLFEDVDLSRTVGWFTIMYPVHLEIADPRDLGACLMEVKERLRAQPNDGIGYGILEHLSDVDLRGPETADREPEIRFNYLGRTGQQGSGDDGSPSFRHASEPRGVSIGVEGPRDPVLDVHGSVTAGVLEMGFTFPDRSPATQEVPELAEAFRYRLEALIDHCTSSEGSGHTPSDFGAADLSQEDLDVIAREVDDR